MKDIVRFGSPKLFVDLNCYDVFPGLYSISLDGTIFNKINSFIVSTYQAPSSYVYVSLKDINGIFKPYLVHRLVAETFCIRIDPLQNVVNHIDLKRNHNDYSNLEWLTQKQNIQHSINCGTFKVRGEDNVTSRLTNDIVNKICQQLEIGTPYNLICERCGIEVSDKNLDIITKIRTKKLWRHISDLYNIPEKEERNFTFYSNSDIEYMCKLLEDGFGNGDIARKMNIDITGKNKSKWYKFIGRIRKRETYKDISDNYKF